MTQYYRMVLVVLRAAFIQKSPYHPLPERGSGTRVRVINCTAVHQYVNKVKSNVVLFNPFPTPGIVVGPVHGRRGRRAAARGAHGAAR